MAQLPATQPDLLSTTFRVLNNLGLVKFQSLSKVRGTSDKQKGVATCQHLEPYQQAQMQQQLQGRTGVESVSV